MNHSTGSRICLALWIMTSCAIDGTEQPEAIEAEAHSDTDPSVRRPEDDYRDPCIHGEHVVVHGFALEVPAYCAVYRGPIDDPEPRPGTAEERRSTPIEQENGLR